MSPQIACLRACIVALVALVWLFSTFQMCSQIACTRSFIITLIAVVWLFSAVCFQMSPQIACVWGCKVTLVTFVWLFSTVRSQMSPQIACPRECKVTLVAFVWLFSTVYFQMILQSACIRRCKFTLVTFVWFFSTVSYQMSPQITYLWGCKVTLVVFIWLGDFVSCFLRDFYICIIQTRLMVVHLFFHCQCVLCCAQMVVSIWVISLIEFWSPITSVSKANFHFLDAKSKTRYTFMNITNCLTMLQIRKNLIRNIITWFMRLFLLGKNTLGII